MVILNLTTVTSGNMNDSVTEIADGGAGGGGSVFDDRIAYEMKFSVIFQFLTCKHDDECQRLDLLKFRAEVGIFRSFI